MGLRFWDLAVVAAVVVLLLGSRRLSGLARSLGQFVRLLRVDAREASSRPRILNASRVDTVDAGDSAPVGGGADHGAGQR